MAHFLRLKLHALCSSRLSSPALASKLLKSPDPRLTSWRWYGEGALLEDHGILNSETDGGSMTANQEESLANEFEGIKGGATKRVHFSSLDADNYLESSLGKLTNLVVDKSEANLNRPHVGKGSTNQTQSDRLSAEGSSKSAKDDKWELMVSSIRSMAHKKKIKAGDANNSGSPKTGHIESQLDFSDLDLPQAGGQSGVSQGPMVSSREPISLAMNTSSKSIKQKNTQSQSSNQQKSKDTMEFKLNKEKPFDFLADEEPFLDKLNHRQQPNRKKPSDEIEDSSFLNFLEASKPPKPRDISSHNKNQQRNKDGNHLVSKKAVQEPFHFKLPKGSDDAFMPAKGNISSISRETAHEASSNSDGVSKQTYMVCVQNLPPSSNPSMVKASMAVHGEVVGLFKKVVRERLFVYIQFKTADAMENALAARKLQIGSKTFYITRPDQSVFTTVVRISKVSNDTDEGQLRSVCERYGKVDDVRKRAYGVFDVFYDVKEITSIPSILASLSEVNLNRSTWYALPAPLLHPSVQKEAMKSLEGQSWLDIQVNQAINRIEAGLDVVSVLFEDMKQLNLVAKEYSK